ncbi:hypothetical protein CKY02_21305 [Photorhabdus bodei]|uniref:Uncharacterized protein n=1 Tax=Photorhabdus bodei TaxID=2029681 RepID=A0A329WUY1_9GAMM|nr:hypothetical protein CKY02_21305 [Photorhabdus bodei]
MFLIPDYLSCLSFFPRCISINKDDFHFIPVIFQVASLLAVLAHPGHIVIYAPGDSLPCRRDAS